MATFKYNNASSEFATGQLNWPALPVNAMLVNANYSAFPSDVFVSAIPPAAIELRDIALTNLAQLNGLCQGVIPTIKAFLSPDTVVALVLYVKRGSDSTSELLYYSSDGPGFPFVPSGFDYSVGYDQAAGGFFQV